MSWSEAFRRQAASDLDVAAMLRSHRRCHYLHYLQMAAEKVAKAYLSTASEPPAPSHAVFVRFLNLTDQSPHFARAAKLTRKQYRAYVRGLLPAAHALQSLAPAVGGGPNCEYPWDDPVAGVQSPLDYTFPQVDRADLIRLVLFIEMALALHG